MQTTTNIGLKTYEANDPTDWLGEFNYNMNKIDEAVGSQNDQIDVIEASASTAVSTANTASTTATQALQTANTKASIDDLVSSTTTTFSSDKINDLISRIQPGTEIDDTTTSTNKTWSSSKINTEIEAVETIANSKASINDTTASNTSTYSSNKIDSLISGAGGDFPDYSNITLVQTVTTVTNNSLRLEYTTTEDCYIFIKTDFTPTSAGFATIQIPASTVNQLNIHFENHFYVGLTSQIFKIKSGTNIRIIVPNLNSSDTNNELRLYKIPIIN